MRAIGSKASPARLSALWFGIQLVWGAILGIALQARCAELAGAASIGAYGAISFGGALAAAVVQLVVGPWSDRARRRGGTRAPFYAVGSACGALAVVAFFLVANIVWLAAAFVALQIALNIAIGPYQAILPDAVEDERRGVASGAMAAMQSGGNACGAILASVLGGPLLGATLAVFLLGGAGLTLAHLRGIALRPVPPREPFAFSRTLVDLFLSRALLFLGFYTLLGYLYFYVRELEPFGTQVPPTTASGICILLFTLAGALGAFLAARPADRFDERVVVTLGGLVVALSVAALALLHVSLALPPVILVAGIGWGVFVCADWAYACRLLPRATLATTMALWNLAIVLPQMLAPLLTTLALARVHALASPSAPSIAFALSALEILIGTAWIWRLPGRVVGK